MTNKKEALAIINTVNDIDDKLFVAYSACNTVARLLCPTLGGA